MTDVQFGRLQDLHLRDAWRDEARAFTPWLAENIDHLAEAIGIQLELPDTEVAVGPYSADILARNPQDGTLVLIENQLEEGDHGHLGQIMTYLAGLRAHTVIWIAPSFREPHLSAIRWLNENTTEDFSFFAVRLRVVRIGNSPVAPIFEIVEKPNDWDRQIRKSVAAERGAYSDIKQSFWMALLDRYPDLADFGVKPWRMANNYVSIGGVPPVEVSVYLARSHSGIYVRSVRGEPVQPVIEALEPHRAALEASLGAELGPANYIYFLSQRFPKGHETPEYWVEIAEWMHDQIMKYRDVLIPLLRVDF